MFSPAISRAGKDYYRAILKTYDGVPWQTVFAGYRANLVATNI